jgi:hypothetical protein
MRQAPGDEHVSAAGDVHRILEHNHGLAPAVRGDDVSVTSHFDHGPGTIRGDQVDWG